MDHNLVKQNGEGISLPDVFFKKNYLKFLKNLLCDKFTHMIQFFIKTQACGFTQKIVFISRALTNKGSPI